MACVVHGMCASLSSEQPVWPAKTVFNDPALVTYPDIAHSDTELRFVNIGQSDRCRMLIVIHTERDDSTRIISSRKATTAEGAIYDQGL